MHNIIKIEIIKLNTNNRILIFVDSNLNGFGKHWK